LYTNADSILNKLYDLKLLIKTLSKQPDIIAITEVKHKSLWHTTTSELSLEGYELFSNDLDTAARGIITGSAVELHCCKAHSKINRKMENSTPCKIVTPKNFNLKLCTRDYVEEATHHASFGSNRYSRGFSPYRRNITTL